MLLPELAAKVAAEGLVTSGFTVHQGVLPDTPNKVISLFEGSGSGPEWFFGDGVVDQPTLQVVTRGDPKDQNTPRLQIERLYQAAQDWGGFTVSGVRYLGLTPLQAPFPFNRDKNERVLYAVNFLVQKELSPTS